MRSTPTRVLAACALAVGALAAAAGCTGGGSADQPQSVGTTGASGTAHASGGGTYTDSGAVLSALKNTGHACVAASASATPSLTAPGLRSATSCGVGSSGGTVTAAVFDNHTDAQAYADLLTSAHSSGLLIGGSSERAVLGENWVVLVPDDAAYANQVSASLGGSVVGPSSSPAG